MSATTAHRNRLAAETSPYLLQHADNPVDWHPWDAAALEKARQDDKPILLSIGYSACHWCHVMAHESFADAATAELMNRLFVNIKVDREERPDLDRIYQIAHQLLTGRGGGWPLTMFLTPGDRVPFFGGTYFPREPRYGMPAFREVLERVADFYRGHREEIARQNRRLLAAFDTLAPRAAADTPLDATPLDMARHQLGHLHDDIHGGFGDAPKFPHPPHIERLLRHWAGSGAADERALAMALFTLERMALGGLYDQLGGGFFRYSVDGEWAIPHFEKMLYDNAQLLSLYTSAYQACGRALFRRVAIETAGWIIGEMQSPEGGYYSTLDADSEGGEGAFYVWTDEAVRALLDEREYAVLARRYGLDHAPNFEDRWHLRARRGIADIAAELGMAAAEAGRLLEGARARLSTARARRARPGRDEKVLTAWNALAIRALALAARVFDRGDFLASAERALAFLRTRLWRDGRLCASCKDGRVRPSGFLDDHAYLLDALLELLQARWHSADLELAVALADALLENFEDRAGGGFYFTAHDHEPLIHRPKPFGDDAFPSGNGVAALALDRLGRLLGEPRYLDAAARTLRAAWPQLTELPYAHDTLLHALEEHLRPPPIVVLRGTGEPLADWQRLCAAGYRPGRLVFAIPAQAAPLPGALRDKPARDGATVAYVCTGTTCSAPITSREALEQALEQAPV